MHSPIRITTMAVALAVAGCGRLTTFHPIDARPGIVPEACHLGLCLAGATEEDEDIVETERLMPIRRDDGGVTSEPGESGGRRLSAHAGLIVPGAAEDVDREPGFILGASYDLVGPGDGKFALETTADFGSVSDASGSRTSSLVVVSGAARFALGGGLYAAGGGSVVIESYTSEVTGEDGTNFGGLLGVGLGFRSGALDARISQMYLPGSTNVTGLSVVTVGYAF